jgi:hypothetical protein
MVRRLIVLLLLTSCTLNKTGLPPSSGSVDELLIVTNDKTQWEGALGDTLRAFFSADQIGLSQPEPMFDLLNIADENLKDMFIRFHNIFIADINPQATQTVSETFRDPWASPQRVIKITAPDLPSFYKEFDLKKENFLNLFIDMERERTLNISKIAVDIQLSDTVAKKFGVRIPIPDGFYKAKEAPGFIWLRHKITKKKQELELGIMIYTMDYQDTIVFNPKHILRWRNGLTLEYIPGPSPISYMKVADEVIPPVFRTVTDFPGGYAVETRGLWEVANDFMGGSFISYTFIDKAANKVITLDGYIYNPNDVKKYYLRELESIFYAVEYTSGK